LKRLVVDGFGKFIGRKSQRIIIKDKGRILHQAKVEDLRQVVISGKGSISFDAMEALGINGVDLIVINWRGEVTARLASREMRTVKTRREQYFAYVDTRSGTLSKQFVLAKMKNQYAVLGTLAKTRKETHPEVAKALFNRRVEVLKYIRAAETVEERPVDVIRDKLMGFEGVVSSLYWDGISFIFPEEFGFEGRSGRYATDPVNSMLNYGYALLEGEVWRGVHYAGLDPYGGFLHVDRPGRPSMVLDLMEEFRQQLIDKTVLSLIVRGFVTPQDFEFDENLCIIGDSARKLLLKAVLERFEKYVRYKGERRRWTDMILCQARALGQFLRGETKRYEGFYLRW